jgi:hypothetical protein
VSFNFLFNGMPPVGLTAGDPGMLVVKTIDVPNGSGPQGLPALFVLFVLFNSYQGLVKNLDGNEIKKYKYKS